MRKKDMSRKKAYAAPNETAVAKKKGKGKGLFKSIIRDWRLYVMLLPALVCLILFHYIPMYGVTIAFKDLNIGESIFGGTWVGLKHFKRLFSSSLFGTIMKNTLTITFIQNFLLWPLPIIFALLIHNAPGRKFRKFSQTVTYIPHLLSMAVVVSLIQIFCATDTGVLNLIITKFGGKAVNFLGDKDMFLPIYFISQEWAELGSSAVVYIAALTNVDPQLIEAATVDGANKLQRIWHVELPAIRSLVILMLIMSMGNVLNLGYEKIYLMQNDLNLPVSEIIGTYVYKTGLMSTQYSFSTAVSLFNNVVGLILVIVANALSRKFSDTALF